MICGVIKTPKVPRPPSLEGEEAGFSLNDMRSLMNSDDRASGFSTKGRIDLRELDAEPSGPPPRAPSLPTDAREYEAPTEGGPNRWLLAVALFAMIGGAVVFVLLRSGNDAAAISQSEAPVAPEADPEAASEQPAPAQPEPAVAAEATQMDESTLATAGAPDEGPAEKTSALKKSERKPPTATKVAGSSGNTTEPAKGANQADESNPANGESEALDTDDIARRAAAVQGETQAELGSAEQKAIEAGQKGIEGVVDDALAEKKSSPRSLDELLDTATGTSAQTEEKKPEPQPAASDAPSKAEVSKVMGSLMPGFRSCAGAQVGVAKMTIAAIPSGKVVSARVGGAPFAGTRQGTCMENVVKQRAKFQPFEKSRFEFTYPIQITP